MFLHCSALASIYWRRHTFVATLAASLQGNVHLSVGWNFYISDTYGAKRINPPDLWSPDLSFCTFFQPMDWWNWSMDLALRFRYLSKKLIPWLFLQHQVVFFQICGLSHILVRFTKNISTSQSHDCGCRCWVFPIIKGLGPALKRF